MIKVKDIIAGPFLLVSLFAAYGCTAANTPDEFSLHGFYGQSQAQGSSSERYKYSYEALTAGTSTSDSDFWIAGGTFTWYIDQPDPPLKRVREAYGHPLK